MLLLTNDDIESVLDMRHCIDIFEHTYRDAAAGLAVNGRRSDMVTPTGAPEAVYSLKMVGAVVPRYAIGAIRINSDILSFPLVNGQTRKVKVPAAPGERWVGLVLLFDTHTGAPLALFPDGVIQRMRVGATSGLGVRYLARADARVAAIIGSGWQAIAQAHAAAAVRPLEKITVYSPDAQRRRAFAARLERELNIAVEACGSAQSAAHGADILLCATNSLQPVITRDSVRPGMHIGSIRAGELGADVLSACQPIVVHDPGNMTDDHLVVSKGVAFRESSSAGGHKQAASSSPFSATARERANAPSPSSSSTPAWAGAPSLASLVSGLTPGRRSARDISAFLNYHGLGYQFAAAGAALLQQARAAGKGIELPDSWFTQDVHS